jgi:hypothetical protein
MATPIRKLETLTADEQAWLNELCNALGRCKVYRAIGVSDQTLRELQRGKPVQARNVQKVRDADSLHTYARTHV